MSKLYIYHELLFVTGKRTTYPKRKGSRFMGVAISENVTLNIVAWLHIASFVILLRPHFP